MATTTTTTASATHTTLRTTELLEHILLFVPASTLLASAQRVCRRWHAVIRSSLALQRALFLVPALDRGPLLPLLAPPGDLPPANRCHMADLPRALQPRPNDLPTRKFRLGHYEPPDADYDGGYMPMVSVRWVESAGAGAGGRDESWRRMLVTQPPSRRVEVLVYEEDVKAWVECAEGVTLGMVWEKCRDLVAGRAWSRRSMGWFFEL